MTNDRIARNTLECILGQCPAKQPCAKLVKWWKRLKTSASASSHYWMDGWASSFFFSFAFFPKNTGWDGLEKSWQKDGDYPRGVAESRWVRYPKKHASALCLTKGKWFTSDADAFLPRLGFCIVPIIFKPLNMYNKPVCLPQTVDVSLCIGDDTSIYLPVRPGAKPKGIRYEEIMEDVSFGAINTYAIWLAPNKGCSKRVEQFKWNQVFLDK